MLSGGGFPRRPALPTLSLTDRVSEKMQGPPLDPKSKSVLWEWDHPNTTSVRTINEPGNGDEFDI